jgi:hypothetical protein
MSEIIAPLNLEERKALLWLRKHEPTTYPRFNDPDCPTHRVLVRLMHGGLIELWPGRKRFDPLTYSLTQKGKEALQP